MNLPTKQAKARHALRFRFRGREVALDRFSPRATLLDWLREEQGAAGTKEGCAEGDCGACTVVLARLRRGKLAYEAVNACILLLGQIDGAELITVEDLAEGDRLHPVQQAMVDYHGSQCGFCTPGIVMSLFAAYHSGAPASAASLCDQLAGNLCRCTDLRRSPDRSLRSDGGRARRGARRARRRSGPLCWRREPVLRRARALYQRFPDATLVAGATDVGLWITKQLRDLKRVIGLGRVGGLDAIGSSPNRALSLGAGVTLAEAMPLLAAIHPDLGELMRRFGSTQVRVSGTVGGNIANGSPIGDLAPALIALGGQVILRKGAATRKLPLEDFFIAYGKQDRAPGEFVLALEAPRLSAGQHYRALKVSKRFDEDISAVMMAVRLDLEGRRIAGARVVFGGMAATPKRAANAEKALIGVSLDERAAWQAARAALSSDFTPLSDQRASAAYRVTIAANLVEKALIEIAGASAPTRIGALHAAE